MPVELIANAIGEELRWVEPALERMKARVLVEQGPSPLVRAFRMTSEGVAFVYGMPRGLRSIM